MPRSIRSSVLEFGFQKNTPLLRINIFTTCVLNSDLRKIPLVPELQERNYYQSREVSGQILHGHEQSLPLFKQIAYHIIYYTNWYLQAV